MYHGRNIPVILTIRVPQFPNAPPFLEYLAWMENRYTVYATISSVQFNIAENQIFSNNVHLGPPVN